MDPVRAINSTIVRAGIADPVPTTHGEMESDRARESAARIAAADLPGDAPAAVVPPEATWLDRDWRYRLLRAGMRSLSQLAPMRAVALFERVWFTPPRTRPGIEGRRWLARGQPLHVRVHGHDLRAWSWGDGPAVLLVHGWGGNAGQMHAMAGALLQRGMRVVSFDAPAHGASGPSRVGGSRVSMIEIAEALRIVAAAAGPLVGVIAHSGGCTATALALREGWNGPQRIAFIAPFALPSMAIEPFGRGIGASAAVTREFRERVERRFARPWTDFDIPPLPGLRTLPPLLLVHDHEDREVPWFHGQAVAEAWPGARLFGTRGLGHRRVLRDARVLAAVAEFMTPLSVAHPRATPASARAELDEAFASSGIGGDWH